jgi:urocanate hydratase
MSCKGWHQEAALRMLMNNLDPDVAEDPDKLIVYGGTGSRRTQLGGFRCNRASLRELENDETLLIQSGKPVGVFRTHEEAPRVLIANSNLVGQWSNYTEFNKLERLGLTMYGQMTAGSWIYIGSQGIVQGTFETFGAAAVRHFRRDARREVCRLRRNGRDGWRAAARRTMAGAVFLGVDVDPTRIEKRLGAGIATRWRRRSMKRWRWWTPRAKRAKRSRSVWLAIAPTFYRRWSDAESSPTF